MFSKFCFFSQLPYFASPRLIVARRPYPSRLSEITDPAALSKVPCLFTWVVPGFYLQGTSNKVRTFHPATCPLKHALHSPFSSLHSPVSSLQSPRLARSLTSPARLSGPLRRIGCLPASHCPSTSYQHIQTLSFLFSFSSSSFIFPFLSSLRLTSASSSPLETNNPFIPHLDYIHPACVHDAHHIRPRVPIPLGPRATSTRLSPCPSSNLRVEMASQPTASGRPRTAGDGMSQWTVGSKIGKGSFASVYVGNHKVSALLPLSVSGLCICRPVTKTQDSLVPWKLPSEALCNKHASP